MILSIVFPRKRKKPIAVQIVLDSQSEKQYYIKRKAVVVKSINMNCVDTKTQHLQA
jgi:hypothetical protein